ncbi:MAG: hypothetical protein A3F17_06185 [Gammaproteobacteria bacterium RIFCSPHIGHO2_12_FULL_41_15]|nr:MAG: hypothetical protein A3F17_06185 [Gammaproteobacteria bacterium RIFCSPHIGHO2_12_FULL_41_15]
MGKPRNTDLTSNATAAPNAAGAKINPQFSADQAGSLPRGSAAETHEIGKQQGSGADTAQKDAEKIRAQKEKNEANLAEEEKKLMAERSIKKRLDDLDKKIMAAHTEISKKSSLVSSQGQEGAQLSDRERMQLDKDIIRLEQEMASLKNQRTIELQNLASLKLPHTVTPAAIVQKEERENLERMKEKSQQVVADKLRKGKRLSPYAISQYHFYAEKKDPGLTPPTDKFTILYEANKKLREFKEEEERQKKASSEKDSVVPSSKKS